MQYASSISKVALAAVTITLGTLVYTGQALANGVGTLTIEQQSIVNIQGSWSVTKPDGSTVIRSRRRTETQDITVSESGSYVLRVSPPAEATAVLTLIADDTQLQKVAGNILTMDLDPASAYRMIIAYEYDGVIRVDSEPVGAPFILESPNNAVFSGTTPAIFTDIPPQYFIAQYRNIEGCTTPKPQRRTTANEVHFFGRYNCEQREIAEDESAFEDPDMVDMLNASEGKITVRLLVDRSESLPGDSLEYLLEVKNYDRSTMDDMSITFQFDPDTLEIVETLPQRGTLISNSMAKWEVPRLFAGRTFRARFPVRMRDGVTEGTAVSTTARASGPDVIAENSTLSDTVVVGAAVLPPTGGRFDIFFLAFSSLVALLILAIGTRKRTEEV